jgi:gliding motility-associated protein GldM
MAGGNLSPRQKMINMMYLVLTALLALNVSKEILDSFVTVNNGLEVTKHTLSQKMSETYDVFGQYASQSQEKYGQAFSKAQAVKSEADALFNYIDTIKAHVMAETDKLPMDSVVLRDEQGRPMLRPLGRMKGKDNYQVLTHFMGMGDPGKPVEKEYGAVELRQKLEAFRDKLKEAAKDNPVLVANFDKMFTFEGMEDSGGKPVTWEALNFYHVPLAAGVTILSKIQTDIRNAESELVAWMLGDVESASFKFNTLAAIVKPRSSYVTVGSKYTAEIFLGAYDNQNAPEVWVCKPGSRVDTTSKPPKIIGEAEKLPMQGAKAILERTAGGAGLQTVSGIIKFTPVGGEEQIEPFFTEYEVAQPNLVVSPTKMNVFYRGVDNPVSISVSGYSDKDIRPSISSGQLAKTGEGWVVRPGKESEATVSATVTNPDGSTKAMQGMKFRVKNVPNPQPYFGGKSVNDETIKKTELTAAAGVIAKMVDFDFDLKFEVVEYRITMIVGGTPIEKMTKGAAVSSEMKEMLNKAKPGQKVYIEGIKARGPDGTVRNLGSLSFKVV